jgi:hypothetical protein
MIDVTRSFAALLVVIALAASCALSPDESIRSAYEDRGDSALVFLRVRTNRTPIRITVADYSSTPGRAVTRLDVAGAGALVQLRLPPGRYGIIDWSTQSVFLTYRASYGRIPVEFEVEPGQSLVYLGTLGLSFDRSGNVETTVADDTEAARAELRSRSPSMDWASMTYCPMHLAR